MSVVVVTGAARGMGRTCVDTFRPLADTVVAVDLEDPGIAGTVGFGCDITDPEAVARLVAEVGRHGELRSLVHAAGISPTMADSRRVFEVDLIGTCLLLDSFVPLVAPGTAAVCFASSAAHQIALLAPDPAVAALLEDPWAPEFLDRVTALLPDSGLAYAWAKRGVIRAVARAAVAWGARGGRVNSLSPGLIDTPMNQQEFEAQPMMQVMLDHTPLGRLGRAEEIAALAAFLVSDAASYISGTDVLADGGMLEGFRAVVAPPPP